MTRALVPLADGCEEMEAVIIIDVLRRAKWDVVAAGVTGPVITASRGVSLVPDVAWSDIVPDSFDVLVLPGGGPGTDNLKACHTVLDAVRSFVAKDKLVGAICAGPLVLQAAGVLANRRATCHPSVRDKLVTDSRDDRVVVDGNLVTSQAPGTAFEFSLTLVRLVDGEAAAEAVAAGLVLPTCLPWNETSLR